MKQYIKCFSLLLSVSLYGCDVPSYIEIENKMQQVVYYETFYHKGNADSRGIRVKLDKDSPRADILFGFGLWDKKSIQAYANSIDSIKISSQNWQFKLDNKDDIYQFFLKRRRGLLHTKLKIVVVDNISIGR